jgi:RNA polymerase sigma-70 factor (ECF subfamily)
VLPGHDEVAKVDLPPTDSFDELITRLRAGDEGAAAALFDRFAGRLIALGRGRLEGALGKEDAEDVVQSVFRSFFLRQRAGQFTLTGWESLWGVLTVITLRKCCNRLEHLRAARRDVGREVSLGLLDEAGLGWQAVARDPTPLEAAVLTETVEHVLRGLEPPDREMLTLHLQGHTLAEISRHVGRGQRTVQRRIELVRRRLRRLRIAEAG